MNNKITLLIAVFIFTRCDKIEDVATVDFSAPLNYVIKVNETTTNQDLAYQTSQVLDAASADPQVQQYANNIKSITVESLKFSIENYNGPQGGVYLKNGVFGFGNKTASNPAATCTVDNLLIINSDAYFDIFGCNAILNKIGEAMTSDKAVRIFIEGTLSSTPVAFDLHVRLQVKVTASAL